MLDAEVKLGELTAALPRASGRPSEKIDSGVENKTPKAQQLKEIGIEQKTAERFERMALHPEAVEAAKEETSNSYRTGLSEI